MSLNESKTLRKYISCKYKCKFDGGKCNLNEQWNNDKSQCECKNPKEHRVCEKGYFWNPATCSCEYDIYVGSIISDYVVYMR